MRIIEKLAAEHDALLASYRGLLRAVSERQSVEVDLQADSWKVVARPEPVEMPADRGAILKAATNGHVLPEAVANERTNSAGSLCVEGGIEGLKKLAEEAETDSDRGEP